MSDPWLWVALAFTVLYGGGMVWLLWRVGQGRTHWQQVLGRWLTKEDR